MGDAQKFTVVTSGEIGPGCDIDRAKAKFAELFKTTVEKSEPYFQGKRRVLRKDLGEKQAKAYEEALSIIGIISDLLPQQTEETIPKTSIELSIVDMESKDAAALPVADTEPRNPLAGLKVEGIEKPRAASSMICPKCKTHQERTLTCEECGVVVEKYRQIASAAPYYGPATLDETGYQIDKANSNKFKIIAALGIALIIITSLVVILL